VSSDGSAVPVSVDVGKTLPKPKTVQWDRHGFINSALGSDLNTGIYAAMARSAMYVDDAQAATWPWGFVWRDWKRDLCSLYRRHQYKHQQR
jgi:hypothetical protein